MMWTVEKTLLLMFIGTSACILGPAFYRRWSERLHEGRLGRAGLAGMDRMSGLAFEQAMAGLFRARGWTVERTPYQGDYGADLVLKADGVRTVVQLKRWRGPVGIAAVQQVVAAKALYRAERSMVVTTAHFTPQAITLARANDVDLWDRQHLAREAELRQPRRV
ncbi:MAG TPA: restriction endonuclease [Bacillota bacterium]|nr:restriction endonuclease [Bacillota bacterium]